MSGRLLLIPVLFATVVLAGCASGPVIDPAITSDIASRGVSTTTQAKMNSGLPLGYDDIMNLVQTGVPEHIIVSYLQSTEKVYTFTPSQLSALTRAGAASELTSYLQETQGFYAHTTPAATSRVTNQQQDEYYNTQPYQDEAPFAYNPPLVDTFFDSGYEESLYSPFSMD